MALTELGALHDEVDDFFNNPLREWSKIKLRIVENYLDAYMRKRGSSNPVIHYVDGFAGAGYYGSGDERAEGSPLRAARLAQRIVDVGKPNRLICTFTEQRPSHATSLEQALGGFDPDIVRLKRGPFRKLLPSILDELGKAPAVFFLDPYGVKSTTMTDLLPLLRRPDTELILNLNTPRLRMLAGFEDSYSKEARKKLALVSRVLGEDPSIQQPEWLTEWYRLGKDGLKWEEWVAKRYSRRLAQISPYLRYALAYAVRERFESNPKYWIVFATRSDHAIPIMNDLVCSEEQDLFSSYRVTPSGTQLDFFDTVYQTDLNHRLTELLDEIHAYGLAHQGCCRDDIIQNFSMTQFGQFKKMHYRQALEKLKDAGRAEFGTGPRDSAPISFL